MNSSSGQYDIIDQTTSLCSTCMKQIEAQIVVRDNVVFMSKECPEHGPEMVYLWPDAEHYCWICNFKSDRKDVNEKAYSEDGCPRMCGSCSNHTSQPTLIELEVTQRCNMRCPVCFMAAESIGEDPSLDQLTSIFVKIMDRSGAATSIQITGGEPTVRSDLSEIIRIGRSIGFESIEVNTNGLMIARKPELLTELKEAGASGIYMQFDGLDDMVYQATRGRDICAEKMQAIANCRTVGLPIVLAMTVIEDVNDDQIGKVVNFALEHIDVVAGVALQPAFSSGRFDVDGDVRRGLTMGDVIFKLSEQTVGMIGQHEMWPLSCSHPLCSCGTQLVWNKDGFVPATRLISRDEYERYFNQDSPQGSIFADILAQKNEDCGGGLSIIIMDYMDVHCVDLNRLRECSMTVASGEGSLIPFCAYHLSDQSGCRIHPLWINEKRVEESVDGS
jgi:tetraether lipid synthase